jgi:hypothetical protein
VAFVWGVTGRHRAGRREEITMKQYMLAVHEVEGTPAPSEDEMQAIYRDVDAVNAEMVKKGVWVFGGGLHPANTATVVRLRDGEVITTDGPFSESKEHLGGFWVIKATDLDEALAWAAKATAACRGPVEVRPFQDDPAELEEIQRRYEAAAAEARE